MLIILKCLKLTNLKSSIHIKQSTYHHHTKNITNSNLVLVIDSLADTDTEKA